MRRHKIRHQILIHTKTLIHLLVLLCKINIHFVMGLSHLIQNSIADMFRRHFQLTADMILTQFFQECFVLICQQIIKTNTGADKNLLNSRQCPELAQKCHIILVICLQLGTRFREQALLIRTGAAF